ncbi:hypothetical protein ACIPPQ_21220 [Sphingopyxis sp. LARHCG72]
MKISLPHIRLMRLRRGLRKWANGALRISGRVTTGILLVTTFLSAVAVEAAFWLLKSAYRAGIILYMSQTQFENVYWTGVCSYCAIMLAFVLLRPRAMGMLQAVWSARMLRVSGL